MPAPLQLAAIDAGSNAIRLLIARAFSSRRYQKLYSERAAVRLGHNVFTQQRFDSKTIDRAVATFQHFRALMEEHNVRYYRAVATSATREARNRDLLLRHIRREAGISLEVISSQEEARLVRIAVQAALGAKLRPRLICDLGGGSLELSLLRNGSVLQSVALPVGTVRLMETLKLEDELDADQVDEVHHYVESMLGSFLDRPPRLDGALAVACGGNAEALAKIAPGTPVRGIRRLALRLLANQTLRILGMSVSKRMKAYGVCRDRAEVMGIAAVVFLTLGWWLKLDGFLVPCVGVREGILREQMRAHFKPGSRHAD
ncbi:MAG: hypothetical protein K6U02_04355 [Firmicutes bacterium]|nr:hypothetical protein [Bacillota bacterium]